MHATEMERRLEEATIEAPQLTPEQREQLLRLVSVAKRKISS